VVYVGGFVQQAPEKSPFVHWCALGAAIMQVALAHAKRNWFGVQDPELSSPDAQCHLWHRGQACQGRFKNRLMVL